MEWEPERGLCPGDLRKVFKRREYGVGILIMGKIFQAEIIYIYVYIYTHMFLGIREYDMSKDIIKLLVLIG